MNGQELDVNEKQRNMSIKTLNIVEDPQTGDLLLELTEELCNEMGWDVGDDIEWTNNHDGSWSLRKKDDSTLESTK